MTQVMCLVDEREISARRCVDAQIEKRCFCPKAVQAINEVAQIATPKSKLEEQLERCKSVVQAMWKQEHGDRFAGPALRKKRGEAEPEEVPLPPPPRSRPEDDALPPRPPTYTIEGVSAPARRRVPEVVVDAVADARETAIQNQETAREHRVTSPAMRALKDKLTPAAMHAGSIRKPKPQVKKAKVKEEPMGRTSPLDKMTDAEFRKAYADAGGKIAVLSRNLKTAWHTAAKKCKALGLSISPAFNPDHRSSDREVIVEKLNISAMTWDQLIAATRELRRRVNEREPKMLEARMALSGSESLKKAG